MGRTGRRNLKEDRRSLASTSVAHFVNDGLNGVIPLMYPVYNGMYGISIQTISIITALQNVFSIVISPVVGRKSDASGNFAGIMILGLLMLAFGTAGYALSVLFLGGFGLELALILLSVSIGVGSSFYHPIGATVLSEKWGSPKLGRAMGINGSIGSIGRVVLPFVAAIMIAYAALPSLAILAALAALGALASFVLLRGVKFERNQLVRPDEGGIWRSVLPNRRLTRRLLPLTVVSFSRGLCTGVFPLIPFYLVKVDHFSGLESGVIYSAALGAGIASQIIFGFMQERFGNRFALGFSNLGAVVLLLAFIFSPNPTFTDISLVLFGVFSYSAFPLLLGMVHQMSHMFPGEMTSAGSIVWGIGNSSGGAAAPLLIGALALPTVFGSLTPGFLAAALAGILAVILMPFT